jgi:hypothetical protein
LKDKDTSQFVTVGKGKRMKGRRDVVVEDEYATEIIPRCISARVRVIGSMPVGVEMEATLRRILGNITS